MMGPKPTLVNDLTRLAALPDKLRRSETWDPFTFTHCFLAAILEGFCDSLNVIHRPEERKPREVVLDEVLAEGYEGGRSGPEERR